MGDDWLPAIDRALRAADVAVLLVSADFLNSRFIRDRELPVLLKRRRDDGLLVAPVIVRPCAWDRVEGLCEIQARPRDGQTLAAMSEPEREQALSELVREIDGRLDARAPSRQPGGGPAAAGSQRVAHLFVGREAELEQIAAALAPATARSARVSDPAACSARVSDPAATADRRSPAISETRIRPVAVCAVQGMAGIGKSYLAERFIYLFNDRFPGGVVRLILPRGGRRTADQLRDELLDRLRLPLGGYAWQTLADGLKSGQTLVLVENVDSPELGDAAARLAVHLPRCPLLVTGRYSELGSSAGWSQVRVSVLPPDQGLEQLVQELGAERARYAVQDLGRLVADLGRLPLAIHVAAGWLRAGCTPQRFWDRLRESHLQLAPRDRADHVLVDSGSA